MITTSRAGTHLAFTRRVQIHHPLPTMHPSKPPVLLASVPPMRPPALPVACPPRYKFWVLVRQLRVGILTTRSARGLLNSRQVQTCNDKNDVGRVLRFLVSVDSLWVRDIALDPHVSLAYTNGVHDPFVSVSGEARITHCPAAQKGLWNAVAMRLFPRGPEDPLLRILEVHIDSAFVQNGQDHFALSRADFEDEVRPARALTHQPVTLQPVHH